VSQRLRFVIRLLLAVTLLAAIVFLAFSFALHRVPEFYEQALQVPIVAQQVAGEQMERQALELHNRARRHGSWSVTFSEQQINGWLATELGRHFPELLPPEIQAPRVAIDPKKISLAFRYEGPQLSTVVQLELTVELTEEVNTVAVRIRSIHAGLLPLPMRKVLDQVSSAADQSDLDIRWGQLADDPVALLRVPSEFETFKNKQVLLESIELRAGEIILTGKTEEQKK
jgi:uncharacterized protein YpmS